MRVPPVETFAFSSLFANKIFVEFDAESRSGKELDGTVLDFEDLGVLDIGEEIVVSLVVVHLRGWGKERALASPASRCESEVRRTFQLISQMRKLGVEKPT